MYGECSDQPMGILSAQLTGLEELTLTYVDPVDHEGSTSALASFPPNLKHLKLFLASARQLPCPVHPPAAALQSLSLVGFDTTVMGLDVVLEQAPLRYLNCEGVRFPSPPPRLRSATLKHISLYINASYPQLCTQDFPQLESVTVGSIEIVGDEQMSLLGTDEEQLHGLEQVLTGLSGFPLEVAVSNFAPEYYESQSFGFLRTMLVTSESCRRPPTTYLGILNLLKAYPALLHSVERLVVGFFRVCPAGLRMTAQLFSGVQHLFLCGNLLGGAVRDILTMPQLQQACIQVPEPPGDILEVLTLAKNAGRHFVLDLLCDSNKAAMLALQCLWEGMQASSGSSVVLRASGVQAEDLLTLVGPLVGGHESHNA